MAGGPPLPVKLILVPILTVLYPIFWLISACGNAGKLLFFYADGIGFAKGIHTPAQLKKAQAYQPTADDVFVCSHFRSGTTLTLNMVYQIVTRGQREFQHINNECPWIEAVHHVPMEQAPTTPRVIKTHMQMKHLPFAEAAKYLYVYRDPCDLAISQHRFFMGMTGPLYIPLAHWVGMFCSGATQYGAWWDHVAGYWAKREEPNLLLLRYEEMIKDLPATVRRVAAHIGAELTDDEVAAVADSCSFANMKRDRAKYQPPHTGLSFTRVAFFRKGVAGTGAAELSPAQRDRIYNTCRQNISHTDFPFEEHYGDTMSTAA